LDNESNNVFAILVPWMDECWRMLVARGEQVRDNVINDAIDEQLQSATMTDRYSSVDDWLTDIKMYRC